jgi:uncharacterized protein (DUF433 family)
MTWPATAAWNEKVSQPAVKWDVIPEGIDEGSVDQSESHPALTGVLRVSRKPSVMGGLYVIGGTRIPAFWVYDMFLELRSVDAVKSQYPHLETDDILAAISFAMTNPELVDEDREAHREVLDPRSGS